MRILITGAGGLMGRALTDRLSKTADAELILWRSRVEVNLADAIRVGEALAAAQPDVVIHAAGRTQGTEAELGVDNFQTTQALVSAMARLTPDAGLILLGSAAQYGASPSDIPRKETDLCWPFEIYGRSKQRAETTARGIARTTGLKIAPLRIFNAVSASPDGGQVFADFLRQAAAGQNPVRLGDLSAVRDFIDIEDVLTAIQRVIERQVWGETLNISTGVGRPVRALIDAALERMGGLTIQEGPPAPAGTFIPWSAGDPGKAEALLGFRPSADLGTLLGRAAAWVMAERGGGRAGSGA